MVQKTGFNFAATLLNIIGFLALLTGLFLFVNFISIDQSSIGFIAAISGLSILALFWGLAEMIRQLQIMNEKK